MPDDLQIPVPSSMAAGRTPVSTAYRPRREYDGARGRAVLLGAAALAVLSVVGLGGWSLLNRKPAVVPVIEADPRPLRVKPENPGGLQFAGADEGGGATGGDRVAPAAEIPAPQALRAQLASPAQPVVTPASPSQAGPVPAQPGAVQAASGTPTAGLAVSNQSTAGQPVPPRVASAPGGTTSAVSPLVPGASPLPDTPPRPQNVPAAAARAAQAVQARTGSVMVQLAALDSEAAAQAEWNRLAKRLPDLLGGRAPALQKAERDGQPVFRVRTGGFADVGEASAFCLKVRARNANCTVATF